MIWTLFTVVVIGIAVFAILFPFIREARKPEMKDAARYRAPGDFAKLSRGLTHYQWLGAARGPVVVCVHGLTTPSFVWGPIAEGLGALGFRVLIYDLYGRGYSDRPEGPQDDAFFVTQLEELLESQKIEDDITLLGYSMGGAIVTAFTALHFEKMRQMVLLAPAGMGHDLGPIAKYTSDDGMFGRWMMLANFERTLRKITDAERWQESSVENIVDLQQAELQFQGFVPAIWQSLRGILSEDMQMEHREIRRERVPVLAIWGSEDEIIPISGKDKLAKWNTAAKQKVIEGAGHSLAYTHTDEVIEAMRKLLKD